MSRKGHIPIRMCVGCRKKRKKEEMLRFVQSSNRIIWMSGKKKVDGRSFYLCPDEICFKTAQKKNRWMRTIEEVDQLLSLVFKGKGASTHKRYRVEEEREWGR